MVRKFFSVIHFASQPYAQSSRWSWAHLALFVFVCLLGFAWVPCYAQTITGTLSGPVTDGTGAAIPGATVRVVNTATGIANETTTDETGNYIFPLLPPATYNRVVQMTGFKRAVISGIELGVIQQARIDARLLLEILKFETWCK